jgi:hypothetical protein
MSVMAGAKIQEEMNNIPLADDDPQGKLCIIWNINCSLLKQNHQFGEL